MSVELVRSIVRHATTTFVYFVRQVSTISREIAQPTVLVLTSATTASACPVKPAASIAPATDVLFAPMD
jgi:hypothetical protein